MDILKILKEIAEKEHEMYTAFKHRLVEYCSDKKHAVFCILRTLRGIEEALGDALKGKVEVNVERSIIIKVLKTIRVELDIIKHKMKHPDLFPHGVSKSIQPVGSWTADKIDLIELIYAIKMSINDGNVSIKALQECFEHIFQVKLGNIYDRFQEINERKGDKAKYLETLILNLNHILEGRV
jgi:hypothetical protein